MSDNHLFIGIPCYQESESLRRTVEAIRQRTELAHRLEVHIAKQSVVKNKNTLLRMARQLQPRYVCFCDDDIEPEQGWDRKLITALERFQRKRGLRIGQTSPRFLLPDGKVFSLWLNIGLDAQSRSYPIRNAGVGPDLPHYRAYALVPALPGTCTIFTADFLDKIDWQFDERYEKSQMEDIDQSLTCRDLGFQLLYNGYVSVIHHQAKATPRDRYGNEARFFDKWSAKPWLAMTVSHQPLSLAAASPIAWERWKAYCLHAIQEVLRHPIRRSVKAACAVCTGGPRAIIQRLRETIHEW